MSDIIQDANRLLEGTTSAPWKFEERTGHEYPAGPEWGPMMTELEHSVQDKDGYHLFGAYNDYRMIEAPGNLPLAAAAPELAQALAEETYFYGVQVWVGGRWIMMLTRDHGTGLMHRGKWFERKDEAQACAAKWNHDTPTRIVRQRRSLVEEIE